MNTKSIILKPGKDKAIRQKHHWIFSGAIQTLPEFRNGEILPVRTNEGIFLGKGYFNRKSSIIGRMISFEDTDPLFAIKRHIESAIAIRNQLIDSTLTSAYRLINAEGDNLPGLVVDKYGELLVIQLSTLGMEQLKSDIVSILIELCQPAAIYEKSIVPSLREEGLQDFQGWLWGKPLEEVIIQENGLKFIIKPENSQKTGFFLDHREMRQLIREISKEKNVLNAFSYTGGFSVYALAGGAKRVDSVDISASAIERAKENIELNGFVQEDQGFYAEDVFSFLRENSLNYEVIILDPPAFVKKKHDVVKGCRGYKDINRLAISKMPPGSFLLTSSCSHFVDENLFQQVIFQASAEAKRKVRIIGRHRLAIDHPINIFHPEGNYLKSLLLSVE